MSALAATSVYERSAMPQYSQIANVCASPHFRKTDNYPPCPLSHTADMADSTDKNGGPNYLRAWMEYRGIKGVELAERLGGNVTPGMVSDLVNSNRALSAKWLRRIAPILDTTPGMLLDHDPTELDRDIIDLWHHASKRQQRQLVDLARVVVADRTGTDDG
jgi:plasmid maintenance system antidote protein VapI